MSYIERERIEKFFDGIYDCADLTFEPNDHCCAADDCAHCKWYEVKNAIQKRILAIPAADVRPVITCGECEFWNRERISCEGLARCNTGESGIRYRNRNDFCSRGRKREEN